MFAFRKSLNVIIAVLNKSAELFRILIVSFGIVICLFLNWGNKFNTSKSFSDETSSCGKNLKIFNKSKFVDSEFNVFVRNTLVKLFIESLKSLTEVFISSIMLSGNVNEFPDNFLFCFDTFFCSIGFWIIISFAGFKFSFFSTGFRISISFTGFWTNFSDTGFKLIFFTIGLRKFESKFSLSFKSTTLFGGCLKCEKA